MPAATRFLLEIKLEEEDMIDKQMSLLLGECADCGFNLQKNGHQTIRLYFKEAFVEEFPFDVLPEAVEDRCLDYLNELNTEAP